MELSWSTFLLEIINFLVLVWILKRFLYRPVLDVLEKRRSRVEQTLQEAKDLRAAAEDLQQQYEGRLTVWENEKRHARESLQQEVQAEKDKLFEQLKLDLNRERKKAAVIDQRHQAEILHSYQKIAFDQGARFAAKLLAAVTGPELENRLFDLFIKKLNGLSEENTRTLQQACEGPLEKIEVCSSYPLSNAQRQKLEQTLEKLCKPSIPVEYKQDTELLAGLHMTLGAWILHMNIRDELSGFAELSHERPGS